MPLIENQCWTSSFGDLDIQNLKLVIKSYGFNTPSLFVLIFNTSLLRMQSAQVCVSEKDRASEWERDWVTQFISQLHCHKLPSNPAPVLRLSPVSLVYSGTVNLNLPPLPLPLTLISDSLSLSVFISVISFPSLFLAVCPLSLILCLSHPVKRWGRYLLASWVCVRVCAHACL